MAGTKSAFVTKTIVVNEMKKLPKTWLPRLRELSLGPYDGSMYRWTFHDGSTYAGVMLIGGEIVGWCCLTEQEETYPILGVYIQKDWRGYGLAKELIVNTLKVLNPETEIILAVADMYSKYPEIISNLGYQYKSWD